ncbi:MAG: hypothetical protein H8E36_15445 [Rhodospirillaceae bacterium]|nr:hypothetical protein [Rhodospirillaceae bacterium]
MSATAMKKSEGAETRRIQFEFSPEAHNRLLRLKEETNASSYAELVRNSIRVYEWIVEQERQGNSIGVFKDGEPLKEVKFLY